MFENLKLRWFFVLSALLFGIYFSWPSYRYYTSNNDIDTAELDNLKDDAINLGLDLKGGLHIVLELDEKKFLEKLSKTKLSKNSKEDYATLINEAYELSQKNNTSILSEFKNIAQNQNIKLNKFLSNLSKSSDNNEVINEINNQKSYAMASILEIMRSRIEEHDQYGLGEPSIQKLGDNRLVVELAGISDVSRAKAYIQRTADFELVLVRNYNQLVSTINKIDEYILKNNLDFPSLDSLIFSYGGKGLYIDEHQYINTMRLLNSKDIKSLFDNQSRVAWANEPIALGMSPDLNQEEIKIRQLYLVSSNPAVTSGMIKTPKAVISDIGSTNAGQWVVNLDMTKDGRRKWSKFTGGNINRQVAIMLDGKVFMAPYIRDKITTGSTQISGFENMQEAKDIASVLKAGELPAPIKIIQTNYIGPSLGHDSIMSGANSMFVGIILVLFFMVIYYRGSGLIANTALILNLLIVFGVLVSMNAVLTLPGIAGLLLTVGMTVDANVIIFERIREEINLGKMPYGAIRSGYNRAFETILDANITTLLTAFVLSFIGSGPIKGFATTLSVGIICSMFTAIFVTKTIFLTLAHFKQFKKISI